MSVPGGNGLAVEMQMPAWLMSRAVPVRTGASGLSNQAGRMTGCLVHARRSAGQEALLALEFASTCMSFGRRAVTSHTREYSTRERRVEGFAASSNRRPNGLTKNVGKTRWRALPL